MRMLPTPSTSHVSFDRIYEPAEDSYLLLDTLSSPSETEFLTQRFERSSKSHAGGNSNSTSCPLVVEVGTGSGVVLSFLHAHAEVIFGRDDILTAGVDVNPFACEATRETVRIAEREQREKGSSHGFYVGNILGDLTSPIRGGEIDVLVFNPPYVPTPTLPAVNREEVGVERQTSFEEDSQLLELSYAGGVDGMEITERLLEMVPGVLSKSRGVAYILLCAQNKPEDVKGRVRNWGDGWKAETVGTSGKKAGWEKLQIIRIWRDAP